MNDGLRESQSGIIEIEDFSPDVIENLLKYIYTNKINEEGDANYSNLQQHTLFPNAITVTPIGRPLSYDQYQPNC